VAEPVEPVAHRARRHAGAGGGVALQGALVQGEEHARPATRGVGASRDAGQQMLFVDGEQIGGRCLVGERRHGALELGQRLRREREVALQGGGDRREVGFGAFALELRFDLVLRRQGAVGGHDRHGVERELGDGAGFFRNGAQDAALTHLDQRRQRPPARGGQHALAGLAGRPVPGRGAGRELARQLRLPLVAAVDGAGRRAAARATGAGLGGALRELVAPLDRDHDAIAAVAAPADEARGPQGAIVGVEIGVGHARHLATGDPVAGELSELAEAFERGGIGCAELGLYLHDRDVTFLERRRGAAAARRVCRAWSVGRGRPAPRPPS
jgi:hypothetical protein